MGFAATFDLRTLNGANGFSITGSNIFYGALKVVAGGGDYNGDGFADLLMTTPQGFELDGYYAQPRNVHVVLGRDQGALGPGPAGITLAPGFDGRILMRSENLGSNPGVTLTWLGDFNGDGFDDVLVGDPNHVRYSGGMLVGPANTGRAYVVFGADPAAGAPTDFSLGSLDGSNGFQIDVAEESAQLAWAVAGIGDVNGDGLDDLMVNRTDSNGQAMAYVVFGSDQAVAAVMNPDLLDGTNGFAITDMGYNFKLLPGRVDLNHDDVDDLVFSLSDLTVEVVFGRDTATAGDFQASYAFSSLLAGPGFSLAASSDGAGLAAQISPAGDVNGDGLDDLIVSFYDDPGSKAAFVVFGRDEQTDGAFDPLIDLSMLDGTNGFAIVSNADEQGAGYRISAVGDVNGDGYGDVAISSTGKIFISPGGYPTNVSEGRVHIVFGGPVFGPTVLLSALDGRNGFSLPGWEPSQGLGYSLAPAGDVNGDGIDDLLIGAPGFSSNEPGEAYVLFGRADRTASAAGGVLNGGFSDDILTGGIGNDTLNGLTGDDELIGWELGDILNGGDGDDQLQGWTGGDVLNGGEGDDQLFGQADGDKLFGGAGADYLSGGDGADRMDGGDGADALEGNDGNDYLDGGAGDDALYGEAGNDIYLFQAGENDTAIEFANQGYDIVRSWRSVSDLWFHIEGLELQGTANLNGTGNANANNLQGNAGLNELFGRAGVDTINGNDGDDVIIGGSGNDLLRGGLGADVFVVLAESMAAVLETDQVYDFSTAEGDLIDLSGIDARAGGADDAFTLVAAFSKQAGQMTLTFAGGITTLRLDVTGDGKVDYQMKLNGDVTGDSAGWLL